MVWGQVQELVNRGQGLSWSTATLGYTHLRAQWPNARFPFKRNRLRCINEKRKRLSSQSWLPLLRPSIPIGWRLRLLRENSTQAIAFEWKPGLRKGDEWNTASWLVSTAQCFLCWQLYVIWCGSCKMRAVSFRQSWATLFSVYFTVFCRLFVCVTWFLMSLCLF